ncbi:MAG TPA: alpha-1,2-fucosyltransferase [Caulobacteraceae bacterium]|jgi:hypothetical protein
MSQVFIAVRGGLGNQMFQAAFGAAIEKLFGAEVRYLAEYVSMDPYGRHYLLDSFPGLRGKTLPIAAAEGVPAYGEQGVDAGSLAELFRQQPRVTFHGYFQNEQYLLGQSEAVADAFRLQPDPALAGPGDEIRAKAAIGMHVRRSEYGHHGLAAADYYRNAIADIRRETGPAPVICFSDEPNYCEFVFRDIADFTVMRQAGESPLNDFRLLSQCRHFVIANSSYSWWAAWLGSGPDSLVYAPLPWCVYEPALAPVPARWRGVENAVRSP